MKKIQKVKRGLSAISLVLPMTLMGAVYADSTSMSEGFLDQNFYNCVLQNFQREYPSETVSGNILSDEQLAKINRLSCQTSPNSSQYFPVNYTDPVNVSGLEKLTNLKILGLSGLNISNIDVSKNTNLEDLAVFDGNLSSIDVSQNVNLTSLGLDGNNLESVDISKNVKLTSFRAAQNNLTSVDVSNNPLLEHLTVYDNKITTLNLANNPALFDLYISGNSIFDFSFIENTAIRSIKTNSQVATVNTNEKEYTLPALFTQVRTTNFASQNGFSLDASDISFTTDRDFTLANAKISADGKVLTILDSSMPATITINGGATDGSTLTVKYVEPENREPESSDTNTDAGSSVGTPNTGKYTGKGKDAENLTTLLIPVGVVLILLGMATVNIRHKLATKTLRKWK